MNEKGAGCSSGLDEFEKGIHYQFKNKALLSMALTHTSYANEQSQRGGTTEHNERIEFLGDSVLGICVSSYIYNKYTRMPEGELTKLRASLVCESSLAEYARRIGLNHYLRLGIGESSSGGANKPSILADAFESLLGAVFLDSDYQTVYHFIIDMIKDDIDKKEMQFANLDYKTNLQELVQKNGQSKPIDYEIIDATGPEHDKTYIARVTVDNNYGTGEGKSKKDAEQAAAQDYLEKWGTHGE